MSHLLLIPSPYVGAVSWRPTAALLPDAIAVDYGGVSAPDWYEGLARRIAVQAGETPWVAVLHSGAGAFAPALAAASPSLAGLVFIDAVLPYPGASALDAAPAAQVEQLKAFATDGLLAPWNTWFPEDPLPRLLPDAEMREAFVRDLPRTPFAFLEARSPDRSEWERLPAAYIQLSRIYEDQAARAQARGWTVRRARLNHLTISSHPAEVAGLLSDLPLG